MKTKKVVCVLLTALCCVATCFGLTCCKKHTHTYTETIVKATCTEEGYTLYECECGASYRDLYTDSLDHDFHKLHYDNFAHWYECDCGETTLPEGHIPSAEATETTAQVCTECGYVIEPALGHVCANHLTRVDRYDSSCAEEGNIEYYTCSCGKWFYNASAFTEIVNHADVVIAKQDHVFSERVVSDVYKASDANCEFPALYYCSCKCGEKSENLFDYGEPLDHDWGDWEPSEEDGLHMRTCSRNSEHTVYSPCYGGSATCAKKAVCEVCGGEYGKLKEHTYSWEWSYDETHHWKNATCGCDVKGYYEEHDLNDNGNCTVCLAAVLPTLGITYAVSEDGTYVEVTGYTGESHIGIRIADTYNGLPVKKICDGAFREKNIDSAIIPNGVTDVGASAFWDCYGLTEAVIGDGVAKIGEGAFYECIGLVSVTIGSGVTEIGRGAFTDCYRLVEVIDKSSLGIAEGSKANGGVAYYALTVHNGSSKIVNRDGYLFFSDSGTNYLLRYGGTDTDLVLPQIDENKTYEIYRYAFYECRNLTSVIIPDCVTSIGYKAFFGNYNRLSRVIIGDGVTTIEGEAFGGNAEWEYIVLGNGVTRIAATAFKNAFGLKTVYYKGTAAEYGEISIGVENEYLRSAKIYCYSETAPWLNSEWTGYVCEYWHYVDGVPTVWTVENEE